MTDLPTKSKTNYGLIKSDKKIFSPYVKNIENFEIDIFRQVIFFLISDSFFENLRKISNVTVLGTLLPVSLGSSHSRGSHRTSHYGFVGCPTECACKINEEKNIIADCSDKELGAIPKFKNDIKTRLIRL